jgi:hypothetical protein
MKSPGAQLTLFGRSGCHLCEELADQLRALGVPFRWTDISTDVELEIRYGLEIPVLVRGGQVLAKAPIDLAALMGRLGKTS